MGSLSCFSSDSELFDFLVVFLNCLFVRSDSHFSSFPYPIFPKIFTSLISIIKSINSITIIHLSISHYLYFPLKPINFKYLNPLNLYFISEDLQSIFLTTLYN
jgi:hypothetical protein